MRSYLEKIPIPARRVLVLYVFQDRVWIVAAGRNGGSWTVGPLEEIRHHGSENLGLISERIAELVKSDRSALMVVLSREFYNTTRTTYPAGVLDNLHRIIEYERQEHTLHRDVDDLVIYKNFKPLVSGRGDSVLVNILWTEKSSYGRFIQLLPADSFVSWTIVPDCLLVEAFAESVGLEDTWVVIPCGSGSFGAYHVGRGGVTESALIGPDGSISRMLFLQKLSGAKGIVGVSENFLDANVRIVESGEFIGNALKGFLKGTRIYGFEGSVRLGLPRVPRSLIPLAVFLTLLVGWGFLMDYRLEIAEKELNQLLKARQNLEERWKPIEANIKTIEKLAEERRTLDQIMKQNVPVSRLFEKLSDVTPDDTWLNYFDLSGGNVVMLRGESKSAVEYVSVLSRIPGFRDVGFVAPVRKNNRTGREMFSIRFVVDWNEFQKAAD